MSFVAAYNYTGEPAAVYHEMTAVVGQDGQLYWLSRDVDEVLGHSEERGSTATRRRVREVTRGSRVPFPRHLADMEVLSHPETMELFRKATRTTVRWFGETLESPETRLLTDVQYDVTRVTDPVYVRLVKPETTDPDEAVSYFFVWYFFFKEAAVTKLYGQTSDSETCRAFVECVNAPRPDAQQSSRVRPFPKEIRYYYRGESVTYVPVARSQLPVLPDSTTPDVESVPDDWETEITLDDSVTEIATSVSESDCEDF